MSGYCVALVTARGGSKRLPRKNALPLAGQPLIAWSIAAASNAQCISRIIVSTDDAELAEIAKAAGAEVPFVRPPALSGDTSSHYDVISHAIDWLASEKARLPDMMVLLQPTSPLRIGSDIDGLVGLVDQEIADSGFTVGLNENHVATALYPRGDGYVRTQDLEPLYAENGAAYAIRPTSFRARSRVLGDHPVAYVMPPERSIDIDTALDFAIAAALIEQRGGR
jgi:CMP-N-acetylneuraminic acid synthetase